MAATCHLTLLHSEKPKLYAILAFLSAIGLTPLDQQNRALETATVTLPQTLLSVAEGNAMYYVRSLMTVNTP